MPAMPKGGTLLIEAGNAVLENKRNAMLPEPVSGKFVVLTVADTGCGIPPELLPHVFDLFVQAERSLDRSQGGLGIGLTLVKHLVELHGGRVWASSEGLGKGTEVTVRRVQYYSGPMIGSTLTRTEGGGRPFRYGGEEFAVLFPGKPAEEALPYLEDLRQTIEASVFIIRNGAASRCSGRTGPEHRP